MEREWMNVAHLFTPESQQPVDLPDLVADSRRRVPALCATIPPHVTSDVGALFSLHLDAVERLHSGLCLVKELVSPAAAWWIKPHAVHAGGNLPFIGILRQTLGGGSGQRSQDAPGGGGPEWALG